jgi:hypothetical protein
MTLSGVGRGFLDVFQNNARGPVLRRFSRARRGHQERFLAGFPILLESEMVVLTSPRAEEIALSYPRGTLTP